MGKVKTLSEVARNVSRLRNKGKTVGLITGCFDILHEGHIDLFEYAKRRCNVVVVGIDSDASVKLSKGSSRPINSYKQRAKVLSALIQVDFIFKIKQTYSFSSNKAQDVHKRIYTKVNPNYVVTGMFADRYWKRKESLAKEVGVKLILDKRKRSNSSTKIIDTIVNKTK